MGAKQTGVLTRLKRATYLGSHPACSGHSKEVVITFLVDGIQAEPRKGSELFSVRWPDLRDLRAENRDEMEARVTATRVLVMGLFAFAVPKRTVTSYLTIEDGGGEWIFAIPGLSAIELAGGLRPLQKRLPQHVSNSDLSVVDTEENEPAARLAKLGELRDSGLITHTEFESKRQAILREL